MAKRYKRKKRRQRFGWLIALTLFVLAACAIRAYVFEPVLISTNAVANVLTPGDVVIVNKLPSDAPARGDVVLAKFPDVSARAIRRVVGLPGDLIMREGDACYLYVGADVSVFEDDTVAYLGGGEKLSLGDAEGLAPGLIPDGLYLLAGDRLDGHAIGLVRASGIEGKVSAVIWPLNRFQTNF